MLAASSRDDGAAPRSGLVRANVSSLPFTIGCFENLKHALAAVGATFEHVVRVTNYFVDMAHLPIYFEVRDRYVDTQAPPASTAIQISKLARDGALFEIEAIAIVPQK